MAADAALADPRRAVPRRSRKNVSLARRIMDYLPQGNMLDDAVWLRRHTLLQRFLVLHLVVLILFGLYMRHSVTMVLITVAPVPVFWLLGELPGGRRVKSFFTTAGIVYCAAALVVLANGAIEAHFDFFIVIGFIALYQDWVPFGWNVAFTVLSHGIGSAFKPGLMFNTMAGMDHPWEMSFVHGFAVLVACIGVVLFWRTSEDEQEKALALTEELSAAEIARRKFTSDLLVNLARRNQSMLYRQLDIINQLEQKEEDPDALFELFRLDHLATRIRRNAENLLVLSGEEPPRVWGKPVPLTDVVRAAIAETEDLSRVTFSVDERLTLVGQAVIDVTHLLAELIENAVRFSPPDSRVTVRSAPDVRSPGSITFTVEDWGVGMPPEDLADANQILAEPRDVDALVSNRLGLHVISRLAHRYSIHVVLTTTAGSGITAVLLMPPELFTVGEMPSSGPLPSQPPAVQTAMDRRTAAAAARTRGRVVAPPVALTLEPQYQQFEAQPQFDPQPRFDPQPQFQPTQPQYQPAQPQYQPWNEPRIELPTPPAIQRPVLPSAPLAIRAASSSSSPPTASIQVDHLSSAAKWDGWWESDDEPSREAPASAGRPAPMSGPMSGPMSDPGQARPAAGPPRPVAPPNAAPPALPPALPPAPGPMTTGSMPAGPASAGPGQVRLARRTPQTHLVPELQRDRMPAATGAVPMAPAQTAQSPDAIRAREALSRYQASRQAALAEHRTAERNRSS